MTRTIVIWIAALVVLAGIGPAQAQKSGKVWRIGYLNARPLAKVRGPTWFVQGMRELGYVQGRDFVIIHRSRERPSDSIAQLASDLVRQKVDVIVTGGPPAPQAARDATRGIPIVFGVVGDPVAEGLVESLRRPGGNVTGLSAMGPDLLGKQLQLFRETLPGLSRIALLWNVDQRGHGGAVAPARAAAKTLGLRLVPIGVRGPADFPGAFRRMQAEGVGGLVVMRGGMLLRHRARLAELARKAVLPSMFGHRVEARAGGLIAYGADLMANYYRAARFVDRIFKGAKPADLPVEQPTKFHLVVNLRTAKALGVTIPRTILLRATEVIE